jgi:hypothetical protein
MPELSIFDARLAEIDRRLRAIQSDLAEPEPEPEPEPQPESRAAPEPEAEPAPEAPADAPAPGRLRAAPPLPAEPAASPLAQLHELRDAHERLLDSHRELLAQYAEVLEHRAAPAAGTTVVAGPFADTDELGAFRRALGSLPGVAEVSVREYLGADRVTLDVRLSPR